MTAHAILVIENNPSTRKLLSDALRSAGYRVVEAADASTALQLSAREAPALVLQDLMLPDSNGAELTRRLRALPGRQDVPIVTLAGFGSVHAQKEEALADASLLKPVELAHLLEIVHSFVPIAPAQASPGQDRLILVVDDDPVQLKLARLRLGLAGFKVLTSSDGAQALELACQHLPALILSDVLMPNLDGFELCLAVRREARLAQVPVVLLSAHYNEQYDKELASKVGATELVVRTPDFQRIVDAIGAALTSARPVPATDPNEALRDEHRARITQQLKRQATINAELLRRSVLQAAQLSILDGIAGALTRTADLHTTLGEVLATCLDAGGVSKGALFRIDGEGSAAVTHAVGFAASERVTLAELFSSKMFTAMLAGQTVLHSPRSPDPGVAAWLGRSGIRWALVVPLVAPGDGGCTGALLLGSNAEEAVAQELSAYGRALGAYIGQALALAESFARRGITAEASRVLASSLKLEETLLRLANLMTTGMADLCEIATLDPAGKLRITLAMRDSPAKAQLIRALHDHHPGTTALDPERSVLGGVTTHILGDLGATPKERAPEHARLLTEVALRSRLVVPLLLHGRVIGSFGLARFGAGRRYTTADLELANDLADRLGVAIENARLYQQVADASRAKDEFLATVSHELRSPLSAILGWATILVEEPGDPARVAHGLEIIERNARAQAKLIEDILDLSRIISGKLSLNTTRTEIGAIVRAAVDVVFPAASAKGLAIGLRYDPGSSMVLGDSQRLQQVLWNVLSNSVKFSSAGGRIDVRVERVAKSVRIEVADTGKGIAPELLPFVFDRFYQADSTSTRANGGLGLGLALVRHLVDLHGGTVRVDSKGLGQGTTVVIELPIAELPAAPSSLSGPRPDTNSMLRLKGVRVLVLDDEADARELLTMLLQTRGVEVLAAATAQEAINALPSFQPEVIVSDISMPGEDGFSFMRRARSICNTPAVALTAHASAEDKKRTAQAGFQIHLCKPVELTQLLDAVARLTAR